MRERIDVMTERIDGIGERSDTGMKLIDNFVELAAVESSKGYKIVLDEDGYSAWIEPIVETEETEKNYYDHHVYLSTHTFYGNEYERSTKILRKFGFDIQLANWDE